MTNVTGYTKENKDPVAHGNAPMVNYLKKAEPQSRQADRALSDRVRAMLDDIEQNRDEAVRRYARDLDRWERPEFRVSDAEIAAARKAVSPVFKDDFAFCKKQVTDFAKRQRDSMHEFEAEVGDGITLGQKIIPVETVGCYIPGGKYPLISAAIMSVATAKVAGVPHVIGAAPPRDAQGIFPATLYALAEVGCRRDLHHRRRAGVRRHGLRLRRHAPRRHDHRSRQSLRRRGQAPAVRSGRHRPAGGPDRDPRHCRRQRRSGARRHRSARPGRARARQSGMAGHDI